MPEARDPVRPRDDGGARQTEADGKPVGSIKPQS
jgi:hypothetical protein